MFFFCCQIHFFINYLKCSNNTHKYEINRMKRNYCRNCIIEENNCKNELCKECCYKIYSEKKVECGEKEHSHFLQNKLEFQDDLSLFFGNDQDKVLKNFEFFF